MFNAKTNDPVVFPDGSVLKDGRGLLLFHAQDLLRAMNELGLFPSEASQLEPLCRRLTEARQTGRFYNPNLTAEEAAQVHTVAERLEALFARELEARPFEEVIPIGGVFDYPKLRREGIQALVTDPTPLLSAPPGVQQDLKGALRALSFDIPTGAAMMALRGTEGMVRHTYERLFQKSAADKDWFDLAKEICDGQRAKGQDPTEMEGYLTFLRRVRNSAQHPGKEFPLREAENALSDAARAAVYLHSVK